MTSRGELHRVRLRGVQLLPVDVWHAERVEIRGGGLGKCLRGRIRRLRPRRGRARYVCYVVRVSIDAGKQKGDCLRKNEGLYKRRRRQIVTHEVDHGSEKVPDGVSLIRNACSLEQSRKCIKSWFPPVGEPRSPIHAVQRGASPKP